VTRPLHPGYRAAAAGALGALLVTLIPASALAEPDSTASGGDTAGEAATSIDWQSCDDVDEGEEVDCAVLEVPLDYTNPQRGTVEIALARRKAADPDNRIGAIVWNPGGPGVPGAEFTKSVNPLTPEAAERFDIVGFDPRGVQSSSPVVCDGVLGGEVQRYGRPSNQHEFSLREAANTRYSTDCRSRTGPLFDHVDTLHVVEDIERIRQALGDEKLNYLGYSYGTLMGQQYAERYPENIRTMVLDGNMDHSLETTWDFMRTETAAAEQNFLRFAEWCDTDTECALHGEGTVAVYTELKERANRGELFDPYDGFPIDARWLSVVYGFSSGRPSGWPALAEDFRAMFDGETLVATTQDEPVLINDAYLPIWCQDWDYPVRDHREWESLTNRLSEEFPILEWTPYNDHALTCSGFRGETSNPQRPLQIEGAPPLVFIGTVHDPATVYPWTVAAAEQAGGHLITYEGFGHTIYGGHSECVNEPVDAYFIDRTAPEDGLRCPGLEYPGMTFEPEGPGVQSIPDIAPRLPVPPAYAR
jgi:pimeloyl-ACP methyl ester carboxylesterase